MVSPTTNHKAVFRVIDGLDAPYQGRILKLRLQGGEPPSVRELKGALMRATSPDGSRACEVKVVGFALFGGRPSDERLARTGRIDVHVVGAEGGEGRAADFRDAGAGWQLRGPSTL